MKFEEILIFGSMAIFVGVLLFTSKGTLSNLADELPSEFDGRNVIYPAGETFTLTFNANKTSDKETKLNRASLKYPYSESWDDIGNGKYDDAELLTKDVNKNGVWDEGDEYTDVNKNGVWDEGESFVDEKNYKNGKYDKGEKIIDKARKNKKYDKGEKFIDQARKNKKWDPGEKFVDANNNEKYDKGEDFTDQARKNKKYDKGEDFTDKARKNKKYDKDEKFIDEARTNGKWDKGEKYTDVPDGEYTHLDADEKRFEEFSDDDLNGVWTQDLLEFRWEKVTSKGGNKKQKVTSLSVENSSKPWLLTYEGNDQGRFTVRLTVLDYRSTNRNEQNVVTQEEWHFNSKRILEKAPKIVLEKVRLTF